LIAGYLWAPTRAWVRRATEVLIALVFTKTAIFALFGIGLALLSRGSGQSLSGFVGATVLMCGACFTPLVMLRLVHFAADTQLAGDAMATLRGGLNPVTSRLSGYAPHPPMGRHDLARAQGQAPTPQPPEPTNAPSLPPGGGPGPSDGGPGAAGNGMPNGAGQATDIRGGTSGGVGASVGAGASGAAAAGATAGAALAAQAGAETAKALGRHTADTGQHLADVSTAGPRPGALDEHDPVDRSRPGPALPTHDPARDGDDPGGRP
jgi:hypothetical protein